MPALDRIVESPCIRRCCLDEHDVCLGCFRSMVEICAWSGANSEERKRVLQNAAIRQQQHCERWEE